ncbi:type I-E CRISPR-associated protein Cse2/CasB (plasmid) [Streptomyces sp. NBC_00464]|uniref:type I-E CRISPR-associated protein Cse2/CasB n=1 Tax=Streptomyces sp. NBC_00464 TaxID=2975751 RepID=UPI002E16E2E5
MPDTRPTGPPQTDDEPRYSEKYVNHIKELCARDHRARAALRSAVARPVERSPRSHAYLVRRLPDNLYPDDKRAYYAIAALIADRPRLARDTEAANRQEGEPGPATGVAVRGWWKRPTLGTALADGVNKRLMKPNTAESDLHLMARQSSEALHTRLPSLLRHLQSGGVQIDWPVLLENLAWWDRDRDRIATRWMESYFSTLHDDDSATDNDAAQTV